MRNFLLIFINLIGADEDLILDKIFSIKILLNHLEWVILDYLLQLVNYLFQVRIRHPLNVQQ